MGFSLVFVSQRPYVNPKADGGLDDVVLFFILMFDVENWNDLEPSDDLESWWMTKLALDQGQVVALARGLSLASCHSR